MLAQGWVTHPQLQKALALQRTRGTGRIGDWLVQECGLEEDKVARGLSVQWGCPVLDLEGFVPERMVRVMPTRLIEEFGAVPLRVISDRTLYLAFESGLDASLALAVERMTELKVESGLLDATSLGNARRHLLRCDTISVEMREAEDREALAEQIAALLVQKQPIESRLVRIHQYYWLRLWLEKGTKGRSGSLPTSGEDMLDFMFTLGGRS
jgi:hypothetical protein